MPQHQRKRRRKQKQHKCALHLSDFNAFFRAHLDTAHASYALTCLIRVCLSVRPEPVDLYRAYINAFAAPCAALKIYIDKKHRLPLLTSLKFYSTGVTTAITTRRVSFALNP